jgi:hypothetical protein
LYVDYEVKTKRIALRKDPRDTRLDNNKKFAELTESQLRALARNLKSTGANVLELDTTRISQEATRDAILKAMPQVKLIART